MPIDRDRLVGFDEGMPLVTNETLREDYDVVVVGSGAGGAMAAYVLAMSGAKVLMIEAGRNYKPTGETPMWQTPESAPLRAAPTPGKPLGFFDATVDGGWNVPGEPFSLGEGSNFRWWRARMLGGRTNNWGRLSLRMGPHDFKARTRDGLGSDWPIAYSDIAEHYDKVERLMGIFGTNEGLDQLENTPTSPADALFPAPAPRAHELLVKSACGKLNIPCIPTRGAILTERFKDPTITERIHPGENMERARRILWEGMLSRSNCHWATDCGRGCDIAAAFQTPTVLIRTALASGNLDIFTDGMVREITAKGNIARSVVFVDKLTRKERAVNGRAVVLAAGALESARILLNSANGEATKGLCNSDGLVGKYIMDTVSVKLTGQIPALENLPPHNQDGTTIPHLYTPWWNYKAQLDGLLDFPRGYRIEFSGGRTMPKAGMFDGLEALTGGSYGAKFKEDCRRYYGSFITFQGGGEMLANDQSYAELDNETVDVWGIPTLKIHWKWSDAELRQASHMRTTFTNIITAMGGRVFDHPSAGTSGAIEPPGSMRQQVGGTRMGAKGAGVVNEHCQSHEVKNLFIADGGSFVTNSDKPPTLTIMALAWRAAERLLEEMKTGNIA